jgi:hypothetical protein
MSFTFWSPDAPLEVVCPHPEVNPNYRVERPELPEVRLPNIYARALLSELGLPVQYQGVIEPQGVSVALEALRGLQGAPASDCGYYRLAEDEHERRYLRTRVTQLRELLESAAERGWRIQWDA